MATSAEIKITADTSQAERALGGLQNSLKSLASITIGSKIAKELFDLADEVSQLNQKLRAVSEGTDSANAAFDTLTGVALRTGQSLAGTVDLFQKLRNSSVFVGSSTEALATVVERFNQTLVLSGTSGEGARSALYNFSQAMQNGTLQGNDYRAMLENNGIFLKVLQKQLGVSATELKMMAEEGRLSAEVVAKALMNADDVATKFANTGVTLSQAMENLKTRSLEAMNNFDKFTNITGILAQAIQFIGNNISGILIAAVIALGVAFSGAIAAAAPFIAMGAAIVAAVAAVGYAIQKLINFLMQAGASWDNFVAAIDNGAATVARALGMNYTLSENTVKVNKQIEESQNKQNQASDKNLQTTHLRNQAALQLDKTLKTQLESELAKATITQKSNGYVSIQLEIEQAIAVEKAKYVNTGETLTKQQEQQIANATRAKILSQEHASVMKNLADLELQIQTASILDTDQRQIQANLDKMKLQYSTETYEKYKDQTAELMKQLQTREMMNQLLQPTELIPSKQQIGSIGSSMIANQTRGGIESDAFRQFQVANRLRTEELISTKEWADQHVLIEASMNSRILDLDQKLGEARLKAAGVTNQAIIDAVKAQMANVAMIQQGGVQGFQGMLGALDNVMGSMAAQNKKAFEAHKALATAQAVISTYQAAAEAIAFPPGPPLSFIYVAGAIAAGMAQVAAIQSQTYSGKALGGSVTGNTPYIVGEKGPEMFVPAGSGTIVPNSEIKGGGKDVNINFNIQANDAAGFDDLLNQRRGMVTQMVRDAMQEQGQRMKL